MHADLPVQNNTLKQPDPSRYLITAALPYSNGDLHVGHIAGAYLPADIYTRFLRLRGREVLSICGSDDHGVAITLKADKLKQTPAEVAKFYHDRQAVALAGLEINFDVYGATSSNPFHKQMSQDFFLSLFNRGLFEKRSTTQFYDPTKEMFLPDRYVKGDCGNCGAGGQNGDQCEECGTILDTSLLNNPVSVLTGQPATTKSTTHWFLDLSKMQLEVEAWFENAEMREHTKAYVKSVISSGLIKRSMTRDISWGIPVPLEDPDAEGKVLYVWFDAPIGYISNTAEACAKQGRNPDEYKKWWKSEDSKIVHFLGEDNTIFHAIIWIAMLSAEGSYQLPRSVVVNKFLDIKLEDGPEKMSKSRGTSIEILPYLESDQSVDALRYYLAIIAPEEQRSVFNSDDMKGRYNNDLANTVGNLVSRVTQFTIKHRGGVIPAVDKEHYDVEDQRLAADRDRMIEGVTSSLEKFLFRHALTKIIDHARECNRYIDSKAPWKTVKTSAERTDVTLHETLASIKAIGVMLQPFLPTASTKLLDIFFPGGKDISWAEAGKSFPNDVQLTGSAILFPKSE